MSDRNCLSAGDVIVPIPVGIRLTIEYNEKGLLNIVYSGLNDEKVLSQSFSDAMRAEMLKHSIVPGTIQIKNGTTYVDGVLYRENPKYPGGGKLSDIYTEQEVKAFLEDSSQFKFLALSVKSLAAYFSGSMDVTRWLTFEHFECLSKYIIPTQYNKFRIKDIMQVADIFDSVNMPIGFPKITHIGIYHFKEFYTLDLNQIYCKILSTEQVTTPSGVIECRVTTDVDNIVFNVPYSDACKYNLQPDTYLLLNDVYDILHSNFNSLTLVSPKITCSFCGRSITVSETESTRCSDPNCISNLFPTVNNFLTEFGLPEINYDKYREWIADNPEFTIVDILYTPELQDIQISCTLPQLIHSIISPIWRVDIDEVYRLCNVCNESIDTLDYYFNHPENFKDDMKDDRFTRIFEWFSKYPENYLNFKQLLNNEKINVKIRDSKFDGPPIFRNKTIFITGKFKHGSYNNISAIFRSYAADVILDNSKKPDCVVMGDILEDIDGKAVNEFKKQNIPIFTESQFFNRYDIESDMGENL